MKSCKISSVYAPIICLLCTSCHSTLTLWLPPLPLNTEDQQQSKQHKSKQDTDTVVVADAAGIGKTHFLVGSSNTPETTKHTSQKTKDTTSKKATIPNIVDGIPLNCDGHVCTVLFDKLYDTLALLIEREQKKISVAAYMITDKRVAHLLEEAHTRGIVVEVVTDLSCLRELSNKLGDLYESGISVYICMPERKGAKSSLMHNKFILFDTNIYGRKIIWTGSANLSRSALTAMNHENVVIFDDNTLYESYEKQFKNLKKRSKRYEDCTISNAALHEKIRNNHNTKENPPATS